MRFSLLKVTLVVFAASTWVFWSFIFATRPETSEGDPLVKLVRLPASLPRELPGMMPGKATRSMEPIEMDVVSVPCWEKSSSKALETSAHWVRLTGRHCQAPLGDADAISVRNVSNGYVATVFPTQNKNLTTDYIPLRSGHNEILIRFNQEDGKTVESLVTFLRE